MPITQSVQRPSRPGVAPHKVGKVVIRRSVAGIAHTRLKSRSPEKLKEK